jgi:hypothetical protein
VYDQSRVVDRYESRPYHRPMPTLLLNLRNVPDDEADEVRALLDAHSIDWYETRPSPWGVSSGGIWARDDDQVEAARAQLAIYQQERAARARAEHASALREGRVETVWQRLQRRPLHSLLVLASIAVLLALGMALLPFLLWR